VILLDDFLAASAGARTVGPVRARRFSGFCFDSRIARAGELFLAVRTERADGHDYIPDALAAGVAGVVCEQPPERPSTTCIVVGDTMAAARAWAARAVRDSGVLVVGVTGSAGKTTTKELCAHLLGGSRRVFKNPGNYSGAYGLPIALGGLRVDHEVAVLEMACDRFGEMGEMTGIAPPTIGVVTMVAAAHLDAFGDLDGVAREKAGLVRALPATGLAVLSADDARVAAMASHTTAAVVTFGWGPDADYSASDVQVGLDGTAFDMSGPDGGGHAHLPHIGRQFVPAALAAAAVARHLGVSWDEIEARLLTAQAVPGRLHAIAGRAGSTILDDSYNASPAAVRAALDTLGELPARRRVAVLGEMAELGAEGPAAHRAVGRLAAERADVVVTRGKAGEAIADAARALGRAGTDVRVTYTAADAVDAVAGELGPDTIVLVKGSAVARMEQVVAGLMARPDDAPAQLVRQDAAWRQLVVLRPERPTWVEVDLSAVAANTRRLVELAQGAAVMAVLKADGYGHGAAHVAHTALRHGASWCGVACLPEAAALREAGVTAPTLVLGYTPAWQARQAIRLDVRTAVFDMETARALGTAAQGLRALARVHVKVDTGMHRLGVTATDAPAFLAALRNVPGLEVEGLFTHLATADDPSPAGRALTAAQLESFGALVRRLESDGLRPPLVHAANSAALLAWPESRYDLVRPCGRPRWPRCGTCGRGRGSATAAHGGRRSIRSSPRYPWGMPTGSAARPPLGAMCL
jgi:UDP-N-acetylmuramoyl-tripeptide--D-alanyl-D-alanine ligase